MQAFQDAAGRTWTISLTIDTLKRVKGLTQTDLTKPDEGKPPLHARLYDDVILLVDVIYAAIKPQADAAGVTDEQFGAALGGQAITNAARAFTTEWQAFFHDRERPDLAAVMQKYRTMMERGVRAAEVQVNSLDVETLAETAVTEAGAKARSILGSLSSSLPESPELTPDPAPSEN